MSAAMRQEPSQASSTVPDPDPTKLTTEAVDRLAATLKELFGVRFDHIEKTVYRLQEQVDSRPAEVVVEISHLRQLMDEKFKGVADQFGGRDTALAAALLAQKTSVDEQNRSNAQSANKAEVGFTKEIDGAKATIAAAQTAFDDKIESVKALITVSARAAEDKIEDIRARIGAVENQKKGASDNWGAILGGAGLLVAIITIVTGVVGYMTLNRAAPIVIDRSTSADKVLP